MQQAAQLLGVGEARGGPEHPALEVVEQPVRRRLDRADLDGQGRLVQQDRGVGEADRDLRDLLQLDDEVDGTVEVARDRPVRWRCRLAHRAAREPTDQVDALARPLDEQHVVEAQRLVAVRVEDPVVGAPHGDDPHAGAGRELDLGQRPLGQLGALVDPGAGRALRRVPEVLAQLRREAELARDDLRDLVGGVRDALDGDGGREHAGQLLGVLAGPRRDHADRPELVEQLADAGLQPHDLAGQRVVLEEDRGVGEVEHQLGRLLRAEQQLLDGPVAHQPPTCSSVTAATRQRTPARSMVAVTIGIPWLSGS